MEGEQEGAQLHEMNPTARFSDRAADYVKHRPDYPAAAIDAMLRGLGPPAALVAADVGAGTGFSARELAIRGVPVIAIEPNRAMREAAAAHALVTWREGTAEATGLEDESIGLLLSAQAFHWFRQSEAIAEFRRVLARDGRLALMWNSRDDRDALTRGYIEAIHAVNGESALERETFEPGVIHERGAFTPATLEVFEHHQDLDREGLIGRATSASYVPREGAALGELTRLLNALFERHRDARGLVRLRYLTKLYLAGRR